MPGNKQISQLTPTTVITNDDLFVVEQDAEAKSIAGRYLAASWTDTEASPPGSSTAPAARTRWCGPTGCR